MPTTEDIKKKKKKWYPILASQEFRQVEIGETPSLSPDSLINRTLEVNLMQLTNDIKKQNSIIVFKIIEIKDDRALTEISKYYLSPSALKRLAFRDKIKIEDSFTAKTKDNIQFRIKPILITKAKTNRTILALLRKKTQEIVKKEASSKTFSEVISSILDYKLPLLIKTTLKKIYPLSTIQIKALIKE